MKKYSPHTVAHRKGFTLAELIVGLVVSGFVLGAVATLAFAMNSADEQTKDMGQRQAEIRFMTTRLSELIRHSSAVWRISYHVILWQGDENGDGRINGSELVYIETNASANLLRITTFPGQDQAVSVGAIKNGSAKTVFLSDTKVSTMEPLSQCSGVGFEVADDKFVDIYFNLTEDGVTSRYQVCGTLMGSAENMFDPFGNLVSGDDD